MWLVDHINSHIGEDMSHTHMSRVLVYQTRKTIPIWMSHSFVYLVAPVIGILNSITNLARPYLFLI